MDMSMPEMGGWEATSLIKSRIDRRTTPIIVAVSALDRDVCLGGKYSSPVDDFVSKPVYANKLTSMLWKYHSGMRPSLLLFFHSSSLFFLFFFFFSFFPPSPFSPLTLLFSYLQSGIA